MIFEILAVLTSFIAIIITSLIIYARWNYGVLESLNIPIVPRSFILGSTPDLHLKVAHLEDIARFKKYGAVYGVYEGRTPQIHICDPELVRQIFSKDFDHFHNRRKFDLGDSVLNEMLDFLPGEKWKTVRQFLTPAFSASKVKNMVGITNSVAQKFSERLKKNCVENNGKLRVEIRGRIAGLVMDFLARCSLGIKMDNPDDPDNYFIKIFRGISGNDVTFGWMYMLSLTFPFLTKFSPTLSNEGSTQFARIVRSAMESRNRSGPSKANDFADKLCELEKLLNTPEYVRLGITMNTVDAQAVVFILAAYDSIVTIITMTLVYLAKNPDIQIRVQREVDDFLVKYDGKVDLENLGELVYLTACINETLRLVPPFIRPERICTKDWEHNGFRIKKGIVVMLPAWAYHRNPDLYPNPEEFDPERFMPENKGKLHPYAMSTYGFGPRNCVGMRLANETMKVSLVHILKNFSFQVRPDTQIKYKEATLFLIMYAPIPLDVILRK